MNLFVSLINRMPPSLFSRLSTSVDNASVIAEGESNNVPWSHVLVHSKESLARLLLACSEANYCVLTGRPRDTAQLPSHAKGLIFVDLAKLNRVVEHSVPDQVISVECGMAASELRQRVQEHHSEFPYLGETSDTICDAIGSGDMGPFEHSTGGMRHLVLGLEVALTDGRIFKTGGKVVKNVTGYDMTKLFVGSRGTLGIPCVAHLRLSALPKNIESSFVVAKDISDAAQIAGRFLASGLPLATLDIIHRDAMTTHAADSQGAQDLVKSIAAADRDYIVCYALAEHQEVIDEVQPILADLLQGHKIYTVRNSYPSEFFQPAQNYLEVSCAPSVVPALISSLVGLINTRSLQWRPGVGRLRFHEEHGVETSKIVEALAAYCRKTNNSFPVAVVYGEVVRVLRAPEQYGPTSELVAAVKSKFDNSNILNPFVRLA